MEYKGQKEWGWDVALYLFFADAGAGSYAMAVILSLLLREKLPYSEEIGTAIAFPLLLIGSIFLFAHLGVKSRAMKAVANASTSWISRGIIITSIFMLISLVSFINYVFPGSEFAGYFATNRLAMKYIEGIGLIFAFLRMIYAGSLLGVVRPIAMWSNPILVLLFVVSSLTCGVAFFALTGSLIFSENFIETFSINRLLVLLLIATSVVLYFYIQGTHRTKEGRAGVSNLVQGSLSTALYLGILVVGLLMPLVLITSTETIFVEATEVHTSLYIISYVAILIGGLLTRHIVLASGVKAPLRVGAFEYQVPLAEKPK